MTNTHPYPDFIIEAVAKGLFDVRDDKFDLDEWEDLSSAEKELYQCNAQAALTALWEASRVDDVDQLPDDAVYLNDLGGIGFVGADRNTRMVDHMEHIIHWGDEL